jgi:hypothetical protein
MKTILTLGLILSFLTPVHSQNLRSETVNGTIIGAIAGAIIGNNSGSLGHNSLRGAAYGAGAGLIIGSIVGRTNERSVVYQQEPIYYHDEVVLVHHQVVRQRQRGPHCRVFHLENVPHSICHYRPQPTTIIVHNHYYGPNGMFGRN